MNGKIENIIFDLGGVLINWSPIDCVYSLFGKNDKSDKIIDIVFNSNIWKDMDRGELSEELGKKHLLNKYPEFSQEILDLFKSYKSCLFPLEENINLLEELKKKGYKIYLLSNIFDEVWKYILSTNNFFHNFDGILLSYLEKCSKPDEEIYKRIINRYNLIPEKVLYIDDSEENIISGKKIGFNTIHLKANTKLKEQMPDFCH